MSSSSSSSWYKVHSYTDDPEWALWPTDAVFHPATRRASRRRIVDRLAIRFAHLSAHKRKAIQTSVCSALAHSWGNKAWAIHLQAFGETLFVLRNSAYTLQDPRDRRVCIVHVDDVWFRREFPTGFGWVEGLMLGAMFVIGACVAATLYPLIQPPTLQRSCTYYLGGLLHRAPAFEIFS